MTKTEIIQTLLLNKQKLYDEFGLKRIGLFGSYAKNLQTEKSDIDLVFEMEETQLNSITKQLAMENYFSKLFHQKKIELVNNKYMNPVIKVNMRKYVIYV